MLILGPTNHKRISTRLKFSFCANFICLYFFEHYKQDIRIYRFEFNDTVKLKVTPYINIFHLNR